jgi:hypothetical protein
MMRAFGSANRFPGAPAASSNEPMLHAWPMQMVETSEAINCIVS